MLHQYETDGARIYAQSFATIRAEADLARFSTIEERVVCRMIHAAGMVDLAAHEREELRERHAHARLGFSDEQMLALLREAGLTPDAPVALPGDPLTVKIWTARNNSATAPSRTDHLMTKEPAA